MEKERSSKPIAPEAEVLAFMTHIMRGEVAEEKPKLAERQKAAELLGKHYGTFDGKKVVHPPQKSQVVAKVNAALKELMQHDRP